MKIRKAVFLIFVFSLFFSCEFFLGQDADTSPENVLHTLWKSFDNKHAYIDIKMDINPNFNNWEEAYLHYKNQLTAGNMDLFNACGNMLNELADPHVALFNSSGDSISLDRSYISYLRSGNFDERGYFINSIKSQLMGRGIVIGNNDMIYGSLISAPHIGYLHIANFNDVFSRVEKIDDAIEYFKKNSSKVIIDVRYNYGGAGPIVDFIASRFTAVHANYSMASAKNGPGRNDFSNPLVSMIKPSSNAYTKPVVLLTNKVTISAAEWFTLALRTQPHVTHVGSNTRGALSIITLHQMINGWYYSISSYKVTDMQGKCYEGFGIRPHVKIENIEDANSAWLVNPANQLLEVVDWLTQGE
ncbi:MAG: S41 family peptidase [Treponema sp.]|jgi:C-terminal processing protease CtpA/Prc|nr:S41 family peptidase [Treponema sp.]